MIEVRTAEPGDGDVLGEIHAAGWAAAYGPLFPPAFVEANVADRLVRWHKRLVDHPGQILLGVLDGRPLALSWFGPSARDGLAEVIGFYGHPDGWGSGIAVALMTGTLNHMRTNGFTTAHLWTARDTQQSRRFYTKCGFTETGATRDHDFGEDNLLAQVEYQRDC